MKVLDKVTRRVHSACEVIGGYVQVCLIPDREWIFALPSEIFVFDDKQFSERFEALPEPTKG